MPQLSQIAASLRYVFLVSASMIIVCLAVAECADSQSLPSTTGLPHPSTGKALIPDRRDFAPGMRPDIMAPDFAPGSVNVPFQLPGYGPGQPNTAPFDRFLSLVYSPRLPKGYVGFWNVSSGNIKFRTSINGISKDIELGGLEIITLSCGDCTSKIEAEIHSRQGSKRISLKEKSLARIIFSDSLWQFATDE